jgi:threonine synthase
VEDEAIRQQIAKDYGRLGRIWCPHTATAAWAYDQLPQARRTGEPWIIVATAHPAKFDTIVEDIIDASVPVPPELAALLELPAHCEALEPHASSLARVLDNW